MAKHKKGVKAAPQPPEVHKPQLKKEGKAKPTNTQQGKSSEQGANAIAAAAPSQATAAATAAAADIDELFGKLKGKKKAAAAKEEAAATPTAAAAAKEGGPEKTKRVEGSKDDIFGTEAALARK